MRRPGIAFRFGPLDVGLALVALASSVMVGYLFPNLPFLPLAIGAGILAVVVSVIAPKVVLFAIGIGCPALYLLTQEPETKDQLQWGLYGIMAVFALIQLFRYRFAWVWHRKLVWVVLGWGIYLWLFRTFDLGQAGAWELKLVLGSFVTLAPLIWFLGAGLALRRLRAEAIFLAGLAVGSAAVAVSFLLGLQPWITETVAEDAWARTYITVGSTKNAIGLLFVIGFAILLSWKPRVSKRWVKYAGLLLFAAGVGYSFSRSSYLALIVVLAVSFRSRLSPRQLLLVLATALAIAVVPSTIIERIAATWSAQRGLDPSSSARLVLWQAGLDAFLAAPLWGVGLSGFGEHLIRTGYILKIARGAGVEYIYAHNYIVSLFALTGLLGGLLGIRMFWNAHRESAICSRSSMPEGYTIQASILAVIVASLFGEPLFDPILFLVFLSLLSFLVWRPR